MKYKNILFRADSSSIIGTGHIMRDLVLASQYKDANIIFAVQNLDGNINYKIKEVGYKIKILKSNDIQELIKLIKQYNIDMIVIDHYEIDYNYEQQLKEKTNITILSFDDTYEKHYCDILLNHNIYANVKQYKNLVPKRCELRCGSKYTLLRNEFIVEKNTKTVFLAMGGADTANLNIAILKVLKTHKNIKVNVITTKANKNLTELKKYSKNKSWIKLYINSDKIAELMKKSDFAIVTPSVIANEVYFMNLDMISIKTASNQNLMYNFFSEKGFFTMEEFDASCLNSFIAKLINKRK